MPYDHALYLENCRKMVAANKQQAEKTLRVLQKTGNPQRKAELQAEFEGWQEWIKRWEQRLKDAEAIDIPGRNK